ncbi:HEPN domain-containing protein [Lactobacillus amylovorus]|uniref:HEPN domain-containing protein n=1 Tax=Lactobacillus amylovorus TaxID=1604 RepID=UPI002155DC86|nr:HEPN domain-containing protein [Lactobacillus amylovorus]
MLGVSVIDTGKSDKGYYHALNVANNVNNIINFLNGFDHRPSQVLELSQQIIQEDGLYQITKKNGHFSSKQTPGILEGDWSASTGIDPDKRPHATMNFDKRWIPIIPIIAIESNKLTSLQKQCARAIDWIGDGIVNSNLTKQFLQIIISLETMLEQDPDKLESKLKKENLWNDKLSTSIEDQLVSTIDLTYHSKVENNQKNLATQDIKKAYDLRSEIAHNGKQLTEDDTALVKNWYDIAYKIIANIMFLGNWNSTYDLWKAANLNKKDRNED